MTSRNKSIVGFCTLVFLGGCLFFGISYLDQDHWIALTQGLVQIIAGSLK